MADRTPEFRTFKKGDTGEKCSLHFLVENEVLSNTNRMEKIEENTRVSFSELQKTLNDFIVEVRSYIGSQGHRDKGYEEVRSLSTKNTSDIGDLKLDIKSMLDHSTHANKSIEDIKENIQKLTESIKTIDKTILTKSDVEDIAQKALVMEKSDKQQKWFDSLPAKISATVALVSFVAFFAIKIILLFMAVAP